MDPQESTCVLACRTGLPSKTGRVCRHAQRQPAGVENLVPKEVGDRNLGRGDEEQPITWNGIQLLLELGELSRSRHRLPVGDERDPYLLVAVLARVHVEAPPHERPDEPGPQTSKGDEAGAGDPDSPGEIEDA